MSFKKPFKAVPIRPKRLKGLDEFSKPRFALFDRRDPINWALVVAGMLGGACVGLGYLLWMN
jgi:hypothetical protein